MNMGCAKFNTYIIKPSKKWKENDNFAKLGVDVDVVGGLTLFFLFMPCISQSSYCLEGEKNNGKV